MKPILLVIASIESIEDSISNIKIVYREISINLIISIKQNNMKHQISYINLEKKLIKLIIILNKYCIEKIHIKLIIIV